MVKRCYYAPSLSVSSTNKNKDKVSGCVLAKHGPIRHSEGMQIVVSPFPQN